MIEMRIVTHQYPEWNGGIDIEIQYRFMLFTVDASGALCPPNQNMIWSEWRTAKWVNAETPEELAQGHL